MCKPNPDLIYELYTDGFKSQLARIAVLLDVFSPLAESPADAQTVSHACRCDPIGIEALLDYLTSINILNFEGGKYSLTPTAKAFLVPKSETYAGDWVLMETDPDLWKGILQSLRSGKPRRRLLPNAQDAWLESYREFRMEESLKIWHAAGIEPEKYSELKVLDMASGCGIKSYVLALASQIVQITCVDSADVLNVAKALAERLKISSQVRFLPGDLHTIDLGSGKYDAVLLGQITYSLTEDENRRLFFRVYKSLISGGTLLIDAIMKTDKPGQFSIVTLLMRTLSGGAAYSSSNYRKWLLEAGFSKVNELSEHWLSAVK